MRTIGIDLGTTNSVISYWEVNEPRILVNRRGNRIIPSVVSFKEDGTVLVGEAANNQMILCPALTIKESKRFMGTEYTYEIMGKKISPQEVATHILRKLKEEAEEFLKELVSGAVVTVPAYFSEEQRRVTRQAVIDAGLEPKRILNEPTAAALAYAVRAQLDGNILVYDLGGGTFDVTILRKKEQDYLVLSSKGNNQLGGMDFNKLILETLKKDLMLKENLKVIDPIFLKQLEQIVERIKIELSTLEEVSVSLPFGMGTPQAHNWNYTFTRETFNNMIQPCINETLDLVRKSLSEAGLKESDIDTVILSGGSTRVPLVRHALSEIFDVEFKASINPDEVVALGAGVLVGMLTSELGKQISFNDVITLPLGVEIEEGKFYPLIQRNTPIPCLVEHTFRPFCLGQTQLVVHILQGESCQASENLSLGCFVLKKDPDDLEFEIKIAFKVDESGLLSVSAFCPATGERREISILSKNQLDNESFLAELKADIQTTWQLLKERKNLSDEDTAVLEEVRLHLDSSNVRLLKRLQALLQYFFDKS